MFGISIDESGYTGMLATHQALWSVTSSKNERLFNVVGPAEDEITSENNDKLG
jgi:hypothetical protein